ncbi:MAG: hypothetical protein ACO1OO_05965 [Flavisolibacter sp.]
MNSLLQIEMTTGDAIIILISIAIYLWITYEIIRSAVRSAIKKESSYSIAIMLAQAKNAGVTSADIHKAIKYIKYTDDLRTYTNAEEFKRRQMDIEKWWSRPTDPVDKSTA